TLITLNLFPNFHYLSPFIIFCYLYYIILCNTFAYFIVIGKEKCYYLIEVIKLSKIKTSISLDKEIYEKIKDIGDQEDRSFSQQVNKILKDYLNEHESK